MNFGVYILIRNHVVVYVGQTYDLDTRLKQHKNKNFDRYHFFECHPDYLNDFEEGLIERFNPEYNKATHAPYSEWTRRKQLRQAIRCIKFEINRLQTQINKEEKQ